MRRKEGRIVKEGRLRNFEKEGEKRESNIRGAETKEVE